MVPARGNVGMATGAGTHECTGGTECWLMLGLSPEYSQAPPLQALRAALCPGPNCRCHAAPGPCTAICMHSAMAQAAAGQAPRYNAVPGQRLGASRAALATLWSPPRPAWGLHGAHELPHGPTCMCTAAVRPRDLLNGHQCVRVCCLSPDVLVCCAVGGLRPMPLVSIHDPASILHVPVASGLPLHGQHVH